MATSKKTKNRKYKIKDSDVYYVRDEMKSQTKKEIYNNNMEKSINICDFCYKTLDNYALRLGAKKFCNDECYEKEIKEYNRR